MTNEEKARDIGKNWDNAECFGVDVDSDIVAEQAALEAMKWKDEQHKKEKQKWITKACEFWEHKFPYTYLIDTIKEFADAMEEEL